MITKDYSKTGRKCRVTFELPTSPAETVNLCGDFNNWDEVVQPLKRRKDGSFHTMVALRPGFEYRFRYLLDGERWQNDQQADAYAPNEFGSEDSILRV